MILHKLLHEGLYSNIRILINDTVYNLHKEILESKSSFFEAMFRFLDQQGTADHQIQLPYEKNIIDKVLEHIYECDPWQNHTGFIYPMYQCMQYLGIHDADAFLNRNLLILPPMWIYARSYPVIQDEIAHNDAEFKDIIYHLLTSTVGVPKDKISKNILPCSFEYIRGIYESHTIISFGNHKVTLVDLHDETSNYHLIRLIKYVLETIDL